MLQIALPRKRYDGSICGLYNGYGFISLPEGGSIFFLGDNLIRADFKTLKVGNQVRFEKATTPQGKVVAVKVTFPVH